MNFPVKVVRRGEVQGLSFGDLLVRRTIVSIYMRNRTPSCDRQVEALAASAAKFAGQGYDLVAVSRDTIGSQKRRAESLGLQGGGLTLVSDPQDAFAAAADAEVDKVLYGRKYRGPLRAAFVLEPGGLVLATIARVDVANHAAELGALVARLG